MEEAGLHKATYSSLIGRNVMFFSTIPAIYLMDRWKKKAMDANTHSWCLHWIIYHQAQVLGVWN